MTTGVLQHDRSIWSPADVFRNRARGASAAHRTVALNMPVAGTVMSKALHSPSHPPSQFEKPHTGSVELILPLTGCPTSITRRADATGGSGAVGTTAVGTARSLHPAEPSRARDTKTTRRAVLSMGHLIFRFRSELLVRVTVDRRLPGGAQALAKPMGQSDKSLRPRSSLRRAGGGTVARRTDGGPRHRSSREGKAFALC